jgi:hypothetical protein
VGYCAKVFSTETRGKNRGCTDLVGYPTISSDVRWLNLGGGKLGAKKKPRQRWRGLKGRSKGHFAAPNVPAMGDLGGLEMAGCGIVPLGI